MFKKVLIGSLAALMLVGVVMGAVSLVAPSSQAEGQGGRGNNQQVVSMSGQRWDNSRQQVEDNCDSCEDDCDSCGEVARTASVGSQGVRGSGRNVQPLGQGQGSSAGSLPNASSGRGQGAGGRGSQQGGGDYEATEVEQVTVTGTVSATDDEEPTLTLDDGSELALGLGPTFYREEVGFDPQVGDELTVVGFYEDGEFKVMSILDEDGDLIIFRDEYGRPMWSGRGRNNA